jgi:large subunit ribosomal protein L2|uniref:Large ribosomal subunit protein uL2 n=1 Tax=candidate division WOR-3 bacterium TaxID=2052148 RepID=A0A7C3UYJ1_UNCW3
MGIKVYKPYTPSRRFYTSSTFEEITTKEPYKPLLVRKKKKGGRNNQGVITAKYRGGGEKQFYRIIDFRRDKREIPAKVKTIEYDPNRSARIALVCYRDGEYRYILACEGLAVGDEIIASEKGNCPIRPGNAMPLRFIPVGVEIHNLQLYPQSNSYCVRAAGTAAQVLAKEEKYAIVKLPSGEMRKFSLDCFATIGRVSNPEHKDISLGKAGRVRHMGRRPRTRAVAMNPVDHPMGGGEGRSHGGRHPCSEKGLLAKGKKTRKKRKFSDQLIIQRRK